MTYKILVVDDQDLYISLIQKILESKITSFSMMRAVNGLEACDICVKNLPNLILMDWEMPIMTGIEAIQKLKANPKTANIPIVMVSSRSKQQFAKQAIEAGAHDFVEKPFKKHQLLEVVEKVLNMKMVA